MSYVFGALDCQIVICIWHAQEKPVRVSTWAGYGHVLSRAVERERGKRDVSIALLSRLSLSLLSRLSLAIVSSILRLSLSRLVSCSAVCNMLRAHANAGIHGCTQLERRKPTSVHAAVLHPCVQHRVCPGVPLCAFATPYRARHGSEGYKILLSKKRLFLFR